MWSKVNKWLVDIDQKEDGGKEKHNSNDSD